MQTFIILVLAILGILVLLGMAITFAWLCGQAGGAVVRAVLPATDDNALQLHSDEISRLIRSTRKAAGLPPIN